MYLRITFGVMIGLLTFSTSSLAQVPPGSAQLSLSKTGNSRSFSVGFMPIPRQPPSQESWLETWDELLKYNAEFVLNHVKIDWKTFAKGSDAETYIGLEGLKWFTAMAKRDHLEVFFVLDPLRHDRTAIDEDLPKSIGTSFGDLLVRRAFINCAIRIARDYQPRYLALGSEMNTYINLHPEDIKQYISLVQETVKEVKQVSPATQVTVTLQYEGLTGTYDGNKQWNLFQQLEPHLDLASISTYPSPYFHHPDAIPENYYKQLKLYTNKSVIIAESGWPTGGERSFGGSEKKQDLYLRRFVELTEDMDIKLWVWWFLHDWDGEGYPDFFKTMGLRTSKGRPKMSWSTWQRIVARRPLRISSE